MVALVPHAAHAQAGVYGEFSVAKMQNLQRDNLLYGVTTGLVVDGAKFGHFQFAGDLQGRFEHKSQLSFNGVTVGPRVYLFGGHGFRPYAEFMVGFARINSVQDDPDNPTPSTDATIQINGGVAKRLNAHWDLAADYSYSQYYAFGGEYNPKTFSVGAVYYFSKR
jgi:outer membrane autotransporter protein